MKLTKSKLKQLIKEEIQNLMEVDDERAIMRAAARRAAERYRKGTGRGGVKPTQSKKPELTPEEKKDERLLDDAGLLARMLLGNGYSVELFDRSWRGTPDAEALLDAIRYIKNIDRSGNWNEIKAKAEEVIKRVSSDFIKRFDSDEEFRSRIGRSYNADNQPTN
jgi:hypothetical protein